MGDLMLARKGRKRRSGVSRYGDGSVVRSERKPREDVREVVRGQRLRLVSEEDVMDQKAESPLGVYFLRGDLNGDDGAREERQRVGFARYDAAVQYARIVNAAKRDMDSPSEDAANRVLANLLGGSGGAGAQPLHSDEEIREGRTRRRKKYEDAMTILRGEGLWVVDAVNTVAIRGRAIAPEKLSKLQKGLDALASHFGIVK